MEEKLGIENLKVAVVAAVNLAERVEAKYDDDNKITFLEALSVGVGSFADVVKVVKSGKQVKAEFLDLDDLEKDELVLMVKNELDLTNDKVEEIIEKSIDFLSSLDDLIDAIKK